MDLPETPLGAAWLIKTHGITLASRLPVVSQVGGRRSTNVAADGTRLETFQEIMRPTGDDTAGHLYFHLRHEVIHFEFLVRLFERVGPDPLQAWIDASPTSAYARRAAFLFETLTGQDLQLPQRLGGNYEAALDPEKQIAGNTVPPIRSTRWRIIDNLPGDRFFCPTIALTDPLRAAAALDVGHAYAGLADEFGEDLVMRAAAWMTLRESKASFAIEGEADKTTRVQRFADVLARRTGEGELPLDEKSLAQLQGEILGQDRALEHLGLRQSPVFVGETSRQQEVVHYVAPPAQDVAPMLRGLAKFIDRTAGQSPVMRAAVAAFGFVYIHPLSDGNGRVQRFLLNDILRRDGVVPAPVILPVSAVISADAGERRRYDRVLDEVSGPLMTMVGPTVSFTKQPQQYPDGVSSNLVFAGQALARPVWRHPDLGAHVAYFSEVVLRTIREEMREQTRYLVRHYRAREAVKEVLEMPDQMADRVLRSIEQNRGSLSSKLAQEIPALTREGVWDNVVHAAQDAWESSPVERILTDRYAPARAAG